MSLPETSDVISRIQQIPAETYRLALLYEYSICGRPAEVVCRSYHSDQRTLARGPTGDSCSLDKLLTIDGTFRDVVVFTVRTAKRKKRTAQDYTEGLIRKVALPLEEDPLAEVLLNYFSQFGKEQVFPYTRQELSRYVRLNKVFAGYQCPIEEYEIFDSGKIRQVPSHSRAYSIGSLRHQRATDLIGFYGFDGFNLAAFGGWSIRSTVRQVSSVMTRYLYANWQAYCPKLMRKPPYQL